MGPDVEGSSPLQGTRGLVSGEMRSEVGVSGTQGPETRKSQWSITVTGDDVPSPPTGLCTVLPDRPTTLQGPTLPGSCGTTATGSPLRLKTERDMGKSVGDVVPRDTSVTDSGP